MEEAGFSRRDDLVETEEPILEDEVGDSRGDDELLAIENSRVLQGVTGKIMAALEPRFSGFMKGAAMKYAIARVDNRLNTEGVRSADELCYILAGFLRELGLEEELCAIFDRKLPNTKAADRVVDHIRKKLRGPAGILVHHKADGNLMHELGDTMMEAQLDPRTMPLLVEMVWQAVRRRAGLLGEPRAKSAWAGA